MVYAMSRYPCSVVLQRTVYIGGGWADKDSNKDCTVLMYDLDTDHWSLLPRYQYMHFAMTVINSRLTLVGGQDPHTKKATNQLATFDATTQDWTYPYPPIPTPHYTPAVSTYNIWLLVAGGHDSGWIGLATVELLNTSTNQWLSASPLPTPCGFITSTIDQDNWYLITNTKQVYYVSFPDIVSQSIDRSTANKLPTLWCRLPDTPLRYSAAIALRGSLLTVGGEEIATRAAIYLYQPESKKWTKVGDLPTARQYCSCVLTSSGELLVAGGSENYFGIMTRGTSRVDVASVLEY